MIETRAFIGGVWRAGGGEESASINPADGSCVATLRHCDVADMREAIEAAYKAQRETGWAELLPHERARMLYRIGDAIEGGIDAIARLQTLDTGKTLNETRALAQSAANSFRYVAAAAETLEDAITPSRGQYLTMSVHEPMGVVGAITPWNSPIASDAQKIAPALAAGNAVILKPAEWTPLVSLMLAHIVEDCGLPAGLLSVLPGKGSVIGEALVTDPRVAKISFTGGTATGRHIAAHAAAKLMPVSLELGGKSPTIVFADADEDQAIAGILFGIFSSTGQSCIAGSRLFVERSIYDRFVKRLAQAAQRLRVGDPLDPSTQVAPLVAFPHRDSVEAFVERARQAGGRMICGGGRPTAPRLSNGAYYLPTIIEQPAPDSEILREEVFGPVLVALPFDDEADLVTQANDSVYGLACGIWTTDHAKAWRIARRIAAGTVWINTYKQFSAATPFGGWKDSGMGREKGREGIRGYMNQKSLYWGTQGNRIAWAADLLQSDIDGQT